MYPEAPKDRRLTKAERLCGRKDTGLLLAEGKFRTLRNFKYCYRSGTGYPVNRIMVSVSKKFFKRAVKRNLIKRRLRECYRNQKYLLPGTGTDLLIIYSTKSVLDYEEIFSAVGTILKNIADEKNRD